MNINGRIKEKYGLWYCSINWKDEEGHRHFKERSTKLPVANNKRKAEAMLKEFISETEDSLQKAKEDEKAKPVRKIEKMRFADYALHWLNSVEGSVDEVTYAWYTSILNNHIVPYFTKHDFLVEDITQEVLQAYFNEKKKSGRTDGKGGLSPTTLKAHKTILGEILKMAFTAHGKFNPIANVKIPQKTSSSASFYTPEQCTELLKAFADEPIYWLVKATLMLGLRRSEVLGLQWDAIDFKKRTISIKHVVVRKVTGKVCQKDETKSRASARTYHMPDAIWELFQDVLKEEQTNRQFFGNTYYESPYIFKWPNGQPYKPEWVSSTFKRLLEKYGLPPIRFHDLRHSCASIMYDAGMGLKEIQAWLGHSSAKITMDTYTHLFQESSEQISECVNAIFSDKSPD